jgi:hypothetical protein
MTSKEILQKVIRIDGVSCDELAERLGYRSRNMIYKTINNNDGMNMKLKTFINWLDELDAQVVIQPLNSDDEFVLDGISEED